MITFSSLSLVVLLSKILMKQTYKQLSGGSSKTNFIFPFLKTHIYEYESNPFIS